MSYRNDHDAALARVDALASENAQLAAENAKLRASMTVVVPQAERTVNRGVAALVLATLAGVGVLAAALIGRPAHTAHAPRDRVTIAAEHTRLRECARALETEPIYHDAAATDPRGAHESISDVLKSTGCRTEIANVLGRAVISNKERAALEQWRDAEASLDAAVSMVREYYAHDPYALDAYAGAQQLWREYDRALETRNVALHGWQLHDGDQ